MVLSTHLDDSLLQSSWVVIHVVTAEAEEAHEHQHEVAVQPSPGVQGQQVLPQVLGLGGICHGHHGLGEVVLTSTDTGDVC